jgi:hypothetical protein
VFTKSLKFSLNYISKAHSKLLILNLKNNLVGVYFHFFESNELENSFLAKGLVILLFESVSFSTTEISNKLLDKVCSVSRVWLPDPLSELLCVPGKKHYSFAFQYLICASQ